MILSRLKQQESLIRAAKASEGASESANRTQQRKCFNCGKPGHFQRNYRALKKDGEQSSSRDDSQGKSQKKGSSKAGSKDKSRRGRQRGKARAADEESDVNSNASAESARDSVY
jgi:hypothetical protein